MKGKEIPAEVEARMVFDYYKQEREEFGNLSRERTALSLQFLVIVGALGYAYNQSSSVILKSGISVVIVVLGLLGLITNMSLEREMRMHVSRARAARRDLGFLEQYADARPDDHLSVKGIRQDKLYVAFMILLMLVGVVFGVAVLVK